MMIAESRIGANTLLQLVPVRSRRAKIAYPESTHPHLGQTQLQHASRAALASTQPR